MRRETPHTPGFGWRNPPASGYPVRPISVDPPTLDGLTTRYSPTAPQAPLCAASHAVKSHNNPSVLVVEAHDVVLAEIIAALHLDQHEGVGAGIFEAMHRLDGNVRRLIRFELEYVIAASDARAAVDDDPMLA